MHHIFCLPTLRALSLSSREMGDRSFGAHFRAGDWQRAVWVGTSWLLAEQGQGSHQNHSGRGYVRRGLHRGSWSHDVSGLMQVCKDVLGRIFCAVFCKCHSDVMLCHFPAEIQWWLPVTGRIKSNSSPWSTSLSWSGPVWSPFSSPTHLSSGLWYISHTGLCQSSLMTADLLPSFRS